MTIETRPSAAHRWTSYRYAGRYGHIMIGATSTQDALNEADRSLTQGAATVDRDRKSTRLNSSHLKLSRMPSSA